MDGNGLKLKFYGEGYRRYAEVILSRPDVRNAFNPSMIQELTHLFSNQLNSDASLRAIVLRGEGKSFCAGADLEWMKSMVKFSLAENVRDAEELHAMFASIRQCAVPVIAVVQGHAMGGALGLMAVSDIVLAVENTQFCFSEVKLGIIPAVISPFVLEKAVRGLANPWMLSGEIFSCEQASGMGLVHFVGTVDKVEERLQRHLGAFFAAGPDAVRRSKKLLREVPTGFDAAKKMTTTAIAECRVGREGQEGLRSFLEKREPNWRQ